MNLFLKLLSNPFFAGIMFFFGLMVVYFVLFILSTLKCDGEDEEENLPE